MEPPDWIRWRGRGGVEAGSLLRRWKEGLMGCLPGWIRTRLDPALKPLILELGERGGGILYRQLDEGSRELGRFSVDEPNAGQLLRSLIKGPGEALILRLPRPWLLLKKVSFPAAASGNLRQVIGFEMDRLTPFSADQVFYDFEIGGAQKNPSNLLVELSVVPRSRVEPWLALLAKIRIAPTVIDAPGLWEQVNLLPPDARPHLSRRELLATTVTALLFVLLLAAALGIPLWQKQTIVTELNDKVAVAKRQADVVLKIQEKLEKSQGSLDYVIAKRREASPAVEVLKRATELLPDDTWLQQFDLQGGKLGLRGMSNQATALIRRLEESPDFSSVVFRSPVVQSGDKERFHLSASVVISGERQ